MLKFFRKKQYDKETVAKKRISEDSLIHIKYNGWISEGIGDEYNDAVEKAFFDKVTKNYFFEFVKPNDKVLDVGAGTGRLSFVLAQQGCDVTAIDISPDMLDFIEKNKNDLNIKTVQGNCEKLPFEDSSFDKVVSLDAMIHFVKWRDFLKEQARVVRPNGLIMFNIYSGENLSKYTSDAYEGARYITNGDYYATANNSELDSFCVNLGGRGFSFKVIAVIPYNFLYQNVLGYGYLSSEDICKFGSLYNKLLLNSKFLNVIAEFENKIVRNLSPDLVACKLVVIQKISKNK